MTVDNAAIRDLGRAIGVIGSGGDLDPGWLRDPVARLRGILADAGQRQALGAFLDEVIPGPAGDRAGYHPLLFTGDPPGPPQLGNLYLVFRPDGAETVIAFAGELASHGAPFELRARIVVPLVRTRGASLEAALGDGGAPLEVGVSLRLPPGSGEVQLDEIDVAVAVSFGASVRAEPRVDLKGFRIGPAPARDLRLDPATLGADAVDVVLGLVRDAVASAPEPIKSHVLPALGLDPALPALALGAVVQQPDALRAWLVALVDGGALGSWFGHLARLLGGAVTGAGTLGDPFRAVLLAAPVELAITLGHADDRLYPGVTVRVGSASAVHLAASAVLLGGPLRGGDLELLPELSVVARSPTPLLAPVLAGDGTTVAVAAGGARGGFALRDGQVRPLLELTDVVLAGHSHPRIDLTHLDDVGGLAADAIEALLVEALGAGPARHLLALIGAVAPAATEPGDVWSQPGPPRLDFVRFVSDPLGALAAFQRDALVRDGWPALLRELGALLGLAPALSGNGTASDPWTLTVGAAPPITVGLQAFRSDTATLHLGLAITLDEDAFHFAIASELLRAELPTTGAANVALFHEHRAELRIAPVPGATLFPGATVHADRLVLRVRWVVGSPPEPEAALEAITLVDRGTPLPAFDIAYPFSGAAPAVGAAVLRLLVSRAAARFAGEAGVHLLALLGLGGDALALPADFPQLTGDLTAPRALLRPWLRAVMTASAADGSRFAEAWLRALSGVLAEATAQLPTIAGSGTSRDPWRARIARDWPVELLAWLDPVAVTPAMTAALAHSGDGPAALAAAVIAMRPVSAALLAACEAGDLGNLATGFSLLASLCSAGDGVVPVESQAPAGVAVAATVAASHADAVAAATAALTTEIAGGVALLISAPFADHTAYAGLIGSAGAAHFDFRQPGIPFDRVDLRGVTDSVPFYTVDLAGSDVAAMAAQLERVIDHLATIRPGVALNLVGHSLAGVAAVRVAATRAARLTKIVTIAAPLLGALPPYVDEPTAATALHVAAALAPAMGATAVRRAIELAGAATRGALASGLAGPVPLAAMAALAPEAVPSGVATVAIVASVGGGLVGELGTALQTLAPPTGDPRLHIGVSASLDPDPGVADLQIRSDLRLELGRLGLAAADDRAELRLGVTIRLERASGWLLGGPGTQLDGSPWPARIRRARFDAVWDGHALTTTADLVDAALGDAPRRIALGDAEAASLIDAMFAALAAEPPASKLLAALRALGVLVPDAARLSADALAALRGDGASYLAPRLRSALAGAFYGHAPGVGFALGPLTARIDPPALRLAIDHPLFDGAVALDAPTMAVSGEVALHLAGATLTFRPGTLDLEVPPWLPPLRIVPAATPPADLIQRLVFSTAADALLSTVLPGGVHVPLDALLSGRVPFASGDIGVTAGQLSFVLTQLGVALGMPPRDGLLIGPAGLLLRATDVGDHRIALSLSTEAPIGGVLGLTAAIQFGGGGAAAPTAAFTIQLPEPPPPAAPGAWHDVRVELGRDTAGLSLALVVGTTRVTLLPAFSGWASLLAGGVALLPHALDEITPHVPASPVKAAVLAVATELALFGPTWSAHTPDFSSLAALSFDAATRGRVLGALATLLGTLGLPGTASRAGSVLTWTGPALSAPASGSASIALDWTAEIPAVTVSGAIDLVIAAGSSALDRVAIRIGLDALLGAAFRATASLGLDAPLGTAVAPRLDVGARQGSHAAEPVLRLLPLATASGDGPLEIALLAAPAAHLDAAALPGALGFGVLLPLISALVERATGSTVLWPGGPTLAHLVDASGLFDGSHRLVDPPPDIATVLGNVAGALSVEVTLGALHLTLGRLGASGDIGAAAAGAIPIPIDTIELDVIFGDPAGGDAERTSVTVLRKTGGAFALAPAIHANHFGVGVRGTQGHALIATDQVRLGGADAFTYFDLEVDRGALDAEFRGVGVEIDDLGISLGAATGGNNAIASGLMKSASSGDAAPAQPGFGLAIDYKRGAAEEGAGSGSADFELGIRLAGADPRRALIGVRAGFGPLYIDQVGIELQDTRDPAWIRFLVDGGVSIAGFTAQVDDLSVQIPLHHADDPSQWGIDLAGLGVAYAQGGISVLGGLAKHPLDPPGSGVEYVGMLELKFQSIGAVAVGAWARQIEDGESFDSLFIFAAVFLTISFAPYFELQALGAGFGYNRALIVPDDINQIPRFSLIEVLDDPTRIDHPMELLESLRMPARKGTFWFAAGIRGALFVVVDVIAVVYVALDKNLEIGVVGVGRLAQPKGSPIVSIELALKARYSTAEGVLSIQAQLTDNSWLLIHDCQLTGGFALFIWFPRAKFVLTIGGYHPAFVPEPEFPSVPRLGFRCTLLGVIQIKGESYFALTNSCVMAGTRFEAVYDIGWLRAWYRAWADFLLSWDPFHYDISIGIELGADFSIDIDLLFGTVHIHFSISVGASLHLLGPPLHGEVTANLGPISITVPFGDAATDRPPLLTWDQFRDRYVLGSDPTTIPVSIQPASGIVPPATGSQPPQGVTGSDPWRLVPEFSLVTTTAMPGARYAGPLHADAAVAGVDLDFAPMGVIHAQTTHRVTLTRTDGPLGALDPDRFATELRLGDFAEAVWHHTDQPVAGTNNVKGLAGVTITATAEAQNPSASVPIATLVDVGPAKPLPFAAQTDAWRASTIVVGNAALTARDRLGAGDVTRLLATGSPARAGAADAMGLGTRGLSGTGLRSLRGRKSPPVVAPLSEGLDLAAVGRGVAEVPPRIEPVAPPRATRLVHAAMHAVEGPAIAPIATRAGKAQQLVRRSPPRPTGTLGRLIRLPGAISQTALAAAPQRLVRGPRAQKQIAALEAAVTGNGAALAAGAVQLWQVARGPWQLALSGDAARVVALGRGGTALLDVELVGSHVLAIPEAAESLALWSLGRPRGKEFHPGLGGISLAEGPRTPIAVGWHADIHVQQVSSLVALARGARLRWSVPLPIGDGVVRAGAVTALQTTIETALPAGVGAVLVIGDVVDPTSARRGDLDLRASGATLGAPIVLDGQTAEAALYPVDARDDFALAVNSVAGFRIKGVLGFRGRAEELAPLLHGRVLGDLLPEGAIGSEGSITATLRGGKS